jgi:hypothetical protein
LKTIVKDIEDVAQATSNGLGANQNSISLAGGGHPQLVEAVIIIFPELICCYYVGVCFEYHQFRDLSIQTTAKCFSKSLS